MKKYGRLFSSIKCFTFFFFYKNTKIHKNTITNSQNEADIQIVIYFVHNNDDEQMMKAAKKKNISFLDNNELRKCIRK